MTIEAPTKYPGLSAAGRKLILPTIDENTATPRPFQLIGSTPVEHRAEPDRPTIHLPAIVELADAEQAPRLRAAVDAAPAEPVAAELPGVETDAETTVDVAPDADAEAIAELEASLVDDGSDAGFAPESWAAGVAAGAEAAGAEAAPVKDYRKFSLIEPDRRWVMVAAIILLAGILAASLTSSFTSVYAMASWVGLPAPVQWLPVVILDVAIVGFSWALMVFARRGARTWSTRLWLATVTAFSVAANFMHTFDHWNGDLSTPQAIMGVTFSSSIPLMALVATEELIRLVFKRLDD